MTFLQNIASWKRLVIRKMFPCGPVSLSPHYGWTILSVHFWHSFKFRTFWGGIDSGELREETSFFISFIDSLVTRRGRTHGLARWAACVRKTEMKATKASNTQPKKATSCPHEECSHCSPAAAPCWELLVLGAGTGFTLQLDLLLGAGTGRGTAPKGVSVPSGALPGSDSTCLAGGGGGGGGRAFFTDFTLTLSMPPEAWFITLLLYWGALLITKPLRDETSCHSVNPPAGLDSPGSGGTAGWWVQTKVPESESWV